mmetsp:Transcript_15316/g.32419  ORF Transcript_15316/g.32419 Transcript_15316/m.32419 type:complete len:249 (-) Transcript_15316:1643-2389(-)
MELESNAVELSIATLSLGGSDVVVVSTSSSITSSASSTKDDTGVFSPSDAGIGSGPGDSVSSAEAVASTSSLGEDMSTSVSASLMSSSSGSGSMTLSSVSDTVCSRGSSFGSMLSPLSTVSLAIGCDVLFGVQSLNRFINMRSDNIVRLLPISFPSAIFAEVAPSMASVSSSLFPLTMQFSTREGLTVSLSMNTSTTALPNPLNLAVPCATRFTLTLTPSSEQSNFKMLPLVDGPLAFTPSSIKLSKY